MTDPQNDAKTSPKILIPLTHGRHGKTRTNLSAAKGKTQMARLGGSDRVHGQATRLVGRLGQRSGVDASGSLSHAEPEASRKGAARMGQGSRMAGSTEADARARGDGDRGQRRSLEEGVCPRGQAGEGDERGAHSFGGVRSEAGQRRNNNPFPHSRKTRGTNSIPKPFYFTRFFLYITFSLNCLRSTNFPFSSGFCTAEPVAV